MEMGRSWNISAMTDPFTVLKNINGVPWIPYFYPLYVSINIPAPAGSVMGYGEMVKKTSLPGLVNSPKKLMDRSSILNGESNYFDWAMFKFANCKHLPEGNYYY